MVSMMFDELCSKVHITEDILTALQSELPSHKPFMNLLLYKQWYEMLLRSLFLLS